jgi:fumarate hydratase class I
MLRSVSVSSLKRAVSSAHAQSRALSSTPASATPFVYQSLFESASKDATEYRRLDKASEHVRTVSLGNGKTFLDVQPEALRQLSAQAMVDISHLLRPAHLQQLSNILKDAEATENDRFVALELLKNANIASNLVLPGCQDTGTAIISGKVCLPACVLCAGLHSQPCIHMLITCKSNCCCSRWLVQRGQFVLTDGKDEEHLSRGVYDTYTNTNLRYSQVRPHPAPRCVCMCACKQSLITVIVRHMCAGGPDQHV